ncbi:efflux transporter [Clavulina sp. PMI_390]|nr:efflux transporter [Clavulina sp. PMI_390]
MASDKENNMEISNSTDGVVELDSQIRPVLQANQPLSFRTSVGIITACTLAMINNIGCGPAMGVTLPSIGADLGFAAAKLQWVVSAYSLTSGCFVLLFGRIADLYGRRTLFLCGCGWVAIWALGCGFVQSKEGIAVMRGLQGLGPAAAIPASLGILAQSFQRGSTRRTLAFATFASGAPMGAAVYNVAGSLLTQYTQKSWRSVFYFQAGMATLAATLALIFIAPDTHHLALSAQDRRVDWVGAALITSGLVLLTFSLGDGETATPSQWKSGYIIALLIVGILLLITFVAWEYHLAGWSVDDQEADNASSQEVKEEAKFLAKWYIPILDPGQGPPPLLRLSIVRRAHGKLGVMVCVAFFVWACMSGWSLYAVLYYQTYLGLNPVHQMIRMLPMNVTGVTCNVVVALAVARIPGIILIVTGCIVTGIAPLLFAVIQVDAPYWAFGFPAAIVSVVGADFIFASGSLFVAKVAKPHEQSLAGGLFNTLTQLGTSIGLSISSIVLDKEIVKKAKSMGVSLPSGGAAANNAPKEALLSGYRAVQWLFFAYAMTGAFIAIVFLRDIGVIARKETPTKENDRDIGIKENGIKKHMIDP